MFCLILNMGNSPSGLCKALQEDASLPMVKKLLEANEPINGTDALGNTALTLAIKKEQYEIAQYLIECGADVCKFVRKGQTPLSAAVERRNIPFVAQLLKHGARPTIQTAFRTAIERGFLDVVEVLKEEGASVRVIYKDGFSPLNIATRREHIKIVQYLIQQGADINESDLNGGVALRIAARNSSFQIVRYLVENGANVQLAKKELVAYAERNEDIHFYLEKEKCFVIPVTGCGSDEPTATPKHKT